jgi:hypothetical protein
MYDIPFDRSFLQLSNGIRHVMPSTDTKPELTAKTSMAQPVSQPAVYANGLTCLFMDHILHLSECCLKYSHAPHNDVSANDGPHKRRRVHKIITLQYLPLCYNCLQYSVQ